MAFVKAERLNLAQIAVALGGGAIPQENGPDRHPQAPAPAAVGTIPVAQGARHALRAHVDAVALYLLQLGRSLIVSPRDKI